VISDVNSTTAAALGIAGTFDTNAAAVSGANLHFKWVSENTLLSKYNGGKGVTPGSFKITNSSGTTATVDLSQGTFNTLGDVMQAINAKNIGVAASINPNGNGLLLTDTAGGAGKLAVANINGTTATDLNIAGTATATTIDGSFEKTLALSATDTLATVQTDIQSLGWGVVANIVNDGSGVNGYHLSLTATNSGQAGRVVIDGGATNIQTRNLVEGQDAAVFMGSGDAANSLLITSSTNQLTGVIPGVTVTLHGASTSPVTLNVTRDPTSVTKQMQDFTEGFNGIVDSITTLTKWDSNTNSGGLLLGDSTTQTVQTQMYQVFNGFVSGAGRYRTLADVGMSLGDGAKITFDSDKFNAAFAADPDAVKNLFTQATTGLGAVIDQSMTSLVDPVTGRITGENSTLDAKIQQYQDQMTNLDSILADKKNRLEEQFANMESVLAGLQSQSSALSALTSFSTSSSNKSSGH
jgi:flagellar hook-associated protein 2